MTTALAPWEIPKPAFPRLNLFRKMPELNRFVPVDNLRIQQEIDVEDDLDLAGVERAIREHIRICEADYQHIGGGGLGYGEAHLSQDNATPSRIRFAIFPLKTGEEELMRRLASLIDFRSQSEPSIARLPLMNLPEDNVDEDEFSELLAPGPRSAPEIFRRLDEMKAK